MSLMCVMTTRKVLAAALGEKRNCAPRARLYTRELPALVINHPSGDRWLISLSNHQHHRAVRICISYITYPYIRAVTWSGAINVKLREGGRILSGRKLRASLIFHHFLLPKFALQWNRPLRICVQPIWLHGKGANRFINFACFPTAIFRPCGGEQLREGCYYFVPARMRNEV